MRPSNIVWGKGKPESSHTLLFKKGKNKWVLYFDGEFYMDFMEKKDLEKTVKIITEILKELNQSYTVIGG